MTDERPFLRIATSNERPKGRHVDEWRCSECSHSALIPVWLSPWRVDGALKGGVYTWACAVCLSRGVVRPVLGPDTKPPPRRGG